MSSTSSQDPQHTEPSEGGERAEPGTQDAPPAPGLDDTGTIGSPYDVSEPAPVASPGPAPWVTTGSPAASAGPETAGPETAVPATDVPATDAPDARSAQTPGPFSPATALSADSATRPHRVERPVPRSGLTEHHSAGYLTGERVPPHQPAEDGPTWLAPTGAAAAATGPGVTPAPEAPAEPERQPWTSLPASGAAIDRGPDTAVILDGATVEPRLRSRAKAHWLAALVTVLLVPVAWYLLADAGARLTLPAGNPWQTGHLNLAALLELAGGLVVLTGVLLAARWSSVGSIVAGSIVIVLGVPFVAVPVWTQELLAPALRALQEFNDLGGNVAHHLVASGSTGRLIIIGLGLVLLGIVSHGARRQGRREAIARARLERD